MRKLFLLLIFVFAMSIPCFAADAEQMGAFEDGIGLKCHLDADKYLVRVSEREDMAGATETRYRADERFYIFNLKANTKYFIEIQGLKNEKPTEKVKTIGYTKYGDTRPIKVVVNSTTLPSGRCPKIVAVYDESGNKIDKKFAEIVYNTDMYSVGKHELKIEFVGKYSGEKPVSIPYTCLPDNPEIWTHKIKQTSIHFFRESYGDKSPVTLRYSEYPDMRDAKTKTLSGDTTDFTIKGLKKAHTYYMEYYTMENGVKSQTRKLTAYTTGDWSDAKYTKWLLSKVKNAKGKTFTIKLPYALDQDHYFNCMENLQDAYPMYFKAKKYQLVNSGCAVYAISFSQASSDKVKEAKAEEKAIRGYLKGAKKKKGTKAKLWYVNERMTKKCHYDYPAYSFYKKHGSIGKYSYAWKSYGILVKHKGVCESYTRAYNAVANRLGIEAKYYGSSKMNHAWSKVKVGKKWYFVDATWSDCGKKCVKWYFLKKKMHGVRI